MAIMDTHKFWISKIEKWSQTNYSNKNKVISKRARQASRILEMNHITSLCDLGCGNGSVYNEFSNNFKSICHYSGYDLFPENYINFKNDQFNYYQKELLLISKNDLSNFKCIMSLGLIDWISDKELDHLVHLSTDKLFIHSFTLKKMGLKYLFYKLYRKLLKLFLSYPEPILYTKNSLMKKFDMNVNTIEFINGPYLVIYITNLRNI